MQLPFSNLQIEHWNPGATMPLVLPVHVVCNTSEDQLHDNIRTNARRATQRERGWLAIQAPHDGVAVLVGSGPSLAESIEAIRLHRKAGHTIIGLNGAAAYLDRNGIRADWQMLIDARPETASLIGPADDHLIASQCHPSLFDAAPHAKLYHLQVEGIDDDLPDYDRDYALVGGAASVGNTATVVAYVMGYRTLHLYGYDSSHRDTGSHAFHQSINDGEPCCSVKWNGKDYRTSLTMKLQAEKFQETGRLLEAEGVTIHVHGTGLLPDMWNAPVGTLSEREKYQHLWALPSYRALSPGELSVSTCLEVMKPDGIIIDFGCGTGRGGVALERAGLDVVMVDFASNCRDIAAMHLPFVEADLTKPMSLRAPYGYCCDVMEHIPQGDVDAVVSNIMASAETVFFQISTVPDNFGRMIKQDLHLSVHPLEWWAETFSRLGYRVIYNNDLGNAAQFVVTQKDQ